MGRMRAGFARVISGVYGPSHNGAVPEVCLGRGVHLGHGANVTEDTRTVTTAPCPRLLVPQGARGAPPAYARGGRRNRRRDAGDDGSDPAGGPNSESGDGSDAGARAPAGATLGVDPSPPAPAPAPAAIRTRSSRRLLSGVMDEDRAMSR